MIFSSSLFLSDYSRREGCTSCLIKSFISVSYKGKNNDRKQIQISRSCGYWVFCALLSRSLVKQVSFLFSNRLTISIQSCTLAQDTSPPGYTNYQETSTDGCTGSASLCTQDLPYKIDDPPDVWLHANVTVPSIELRVDNLQARLNLDAKIASLVNLAAGVSVGITTVQLEILGEWKRPAQPFLVHSIIVSRCQCWSSTVDPIR